MKNGYPENVQKRPVRPENVRNLSRFGTLPGYLNRPKNMPKRERFRTFSGRTGRFPDTHLS
jgi:hypothetical protein